MGRLCVFGAMGAGARPCGGPLRPFRKRAGAGGAGQKQAAWWCRRGEVGRGMERGVVEGSRTMRGGGGEHAARGHCLTGIEPLRGSTTSFSVTSGARSPAAFRPRWPLSAPLIASAPVPAPALVPRPSAPLASLRSFNRFRSYSRPGALSPARSRSRSRRVPVPAPGASLSPLPARPCSRSRLLSPLHSGRPLLPYLRKKNSGPPKEGSGVESRSAREAASPSMRWITSLRQEPGA